MSEVQFKSESDGSGTFFIEENGERIAFIAVRMHGARLSAIHAEVSPAWRRKQLGNRVLDALVDYTRKNGLKVVPLCPFVRVQFQRHPERYTDVWDKNP
jgi:predicted GNAT family acetyltransferase